MSQQWEETTAVHQQAFREAFGSNAVKNGPIDIQSLQMHSTWQVRMQALRQPLGHHQMVGDSWILLVGQESLVEPCKRGDQVVPF
jgi:hypothetical protein